MKYKINYASVFAICLVLAAAVFYWLFGLGGLLMLGGMCLFYGTANVFIFSQLPLDPDEKFFFGFFISFVFFPLFVWYVNRIVPSFRISIIILVIVIGMAWTLIKLLKKDDKTKRKDN